MSSDGTDGFDAFVTETEPRLRQALVGLCGPEDARDAIQEALVYAWRHWPRVSQMDNPGGYLYRVARSRIRWPRRLHVDDLAVHPVRRPGTSPAEHRRRDRPRDRAR